MEGLGSSGGTCSRANRREGHQGDRQKDDGMYLPLPPLLPSPLPPHRYPPPMARAIGPPRYRDPPRRSRSGAGEGRQWCKAIVVCRGSEITSQVKPSQVCLVSGKLREHKARADDA